MAYREAQESRAKDEKIRQNKQIPAFQPLHQHSS
jgi:hypothetical protein